MKATLALRKVMEIRGVKPAVLCDRIDIKANVLSERFRQENISVAKLNEMLKAMDYKIIVVPRDVRVPDGGFDIE